MTTLKEISENLKIDQEYDFPRNMMDIDIGDYTFTDVKQHDSEGFLYLYTNKDNPRVKLLFNEDRMAVVLYELEDDDITVKATSWRLGKIFTRTFKKDEL
ncbi:MAG: hypothetical protein E7Z85_08800 [Methanosphaera stadtmanae]|nr:hypothetical protein [Methanosphaera stadtmanae]